uniref:Serpentine receptor class gamma n=1 Tax=Parastrongyloides trichosuri TaxID=131310 RepID=A0A0N4ZRL7_PARTI
MNTYPSISPIECRFKYVFLIFSMYIFQYSFILQSVQLLASIMAPIYYKLYLNTIKFKFANIVIIAILSVVTISIMFVPNYGENKMPFCHAIKSWSSAYNVLEEITTGLILLTSLVSSIVGFKEIRKKVSNCALGKPYVLTFLFNLISFFIFHCIVNIVFFIIVLMKGDSTILTNIIDVGLFTMSLGTISPLLFYGMRNKDINEHLTKVPVFKTVFTKISIQASTTTPVQTYLKNQGQ